MLFVGFDELERVEYHRKFGDTWNIPRIVYVEHPPVLTHLYHQEPRLGGNSAHFPHFSHVTD